MSVRIASGEEAFTCKQGRANAVNTGRVESKDRQIDGSALLVVAYGVWSTYATETGALQYMHQCGSVQMDMYACEPGIERTWKEELEKTWRMSHRDFFF